MFCKGRANELRIDAAEVTCAKAKGQSAAASVLVERSRTQEKSGFVPIWNLH
jgi:hypothetical protein